MAIFRRSVYEVLFSEIREQFGSAGEAFLYYEGFNVGRKVFGDYKRITGTEEVEDIIEAGIAINMTLGWGIIEAEVDQKSEKAKVRIYQNFECETGKGSTKPYSQFYRGAIAGAFTELFGKEVTVEEEECIAKGDPYCQFTVKTSEASPSS